MKTKTKSTYVSSGNWSPLWLLRGFPPSGEVVVRLILPAIIAALFGGLIAFLLHRSLFHGGAQSFDAMLYIRSLWGIGHGVFFNSVMQQNCFAVHGHFALLALVPFTWLFSSAYVLIGAQALSLSATMFMAIRGLNARFDFQAEGAWRIGIARVGATGVLLSLGSPIILNPFLFDLHPGLLGIPFVTAGLLRRARHGRFDTWAVVLLFFSIGAREEYALVVAAALLFSAYSNPSDLRVRSKVSLALLSIGYFVGYWLWARGVSLESAALLLNGGGTNGVPLPPDFYWFKLKLMIVVLLSIGCWPLLGWRMLGAVVPGVLLLLANRWLVEGQLRFQYSMFVIPGLIAAAAEGEQRVTQLALKWRWGAYLLATGVAVVSFVWASAAPGGGQFQHVAFSMKDSAGEFALNVTEYDQRIEQAHALLADVPPHSGLVVPFQLGAAVAERETIWPLFKLVAHLQQSKPFPREIQSVVIFAGDFKTAGRYLIAREHFHVVQSKGPLIHLSR